MPVNSQHKQYKEYLDKWQRCRDVASGQDAVHAAGEKYLPRLKSQLPDDYRAYVRRATFYNATWRTIAGLTGMLFRRPPHVEVPESVRPLLDDVDAAGTPFQLFLQEASEDDLTVGRVGVLVDYPPADPAASRADAQRLNLRPTMQLYRTESIINWATGSVANRTALTLVVLKESEAIVADEFEHTEEDRYRVLDLGGPGGAYRQRVFKAKMATRTTAGVASAVVAFEQDGGDVVPLMNNKPLDYIPFVFVGVDSTSPEAEEPPLIDLVDLNLSHYRMTADYEHGCHFTALPTLFLAGFTKELDAAGRPVEVYVGSEQAIVATSPEAKASFVEFSGAGLGALEKSLERKERQMAVLGARMLEPQVRQVEAAETAAIHRKGEESTLAAMAQAISLGMTQALKWFTEWAGADPSGAEVELNRRFFPSPMSPAMLSSLLMGWQQGAPGLSDQGLFAQLQAGEVVAEDTTLEEEQARIADRQVENIRQQAELAATFGGGPRAEAET